MRKIWYLVAAVAVVFLTIAFTSDHSLNIHNNWVMTLLEDKGSTLLDLLILYLAHRCFNHFRTHQLLNSTRCQDTNKNDLTNPLVVAWGIAWIIAIALVIG